MVATLRFPENAAGRTGNPVQENSKKMIFPRACQGDINRLVWRAFADVETVDCRIPRLFWLENLWLKDVWPENATPLFRPCNIGGCRALMPRRFGRGEKIVMLLRGET
jgi:hypothetical protein